MYPKSNYMLKVNNHKEFCYFEYESEVSPNYQLGDVLYKSYVDENNSTGENQPPEIGVVIQTFNDGDVRTDMWGMCSQSEVRPATIDDIKKYRNELMSSLLIK